MPDPGEQRSRSSGSASPFLSRLQRRPLKQPPVGSRFGTEAPTAGAALAAHRPPPPPRLPAWQVPWGKTSPQRRGWAHPPPQHTPLQPRRAKEPRRRQDTHPPANGRRTVPPAGSASRAGGAELGAGQPPSPASPLTRRTRRAPAPPPLPAHWPHLSAKRGLRHRSWNSTWSPRWGAGGAPRPARGGAPGAAAEVGAQGRRSAAGGEPPPPLRRDAPGGSNQQSPGRRVGASGEAERKGGGGKGQRKPSVVPARGAVPGRPCSAQLPWDLSPAPSTKDQLRFSCPTALLGSAAPLPSVVYKSFVLFASPFHQPSKVSLFLHLMLKQQWLSPLEVITLGANSDLGKQSGLLARYSGLRC